MNQTNQLQPTATINSILIPAQFENLIAVVVCLNLLSRAKTESNSTNRHQIQTAGMEWFRKQSKQAQTN